MAERLSSPVFFHALAVFACRRNRLYRIYVKPDELIFIWAGSGSEGVAGAQVVTTQGLVGALIGSAVKAALDPSKKNTERRVVLDRTPLDELVGDHPQNLRALVNEFEEVRIGPRSERHARAYSDYGHQALLYLRHRSLGKYRLGIAAVEDVQVAIRELPRLLGEKCRIDVEWSESKQKFKPRAGTGE